MVNQVQGERFLASDLPDGRVAVLFCADWCGYCGRFVRDFKAIREGWIVDISDEDLSHWDDFDIEVVPTVVLFENRKPLRRWAGVLGARHVDEIRQALDALA